VGQIVGQIGSGLEKSVFHPLFLTQQNILYFKTLRAYSASEKDRVRKLPVALFQEAYISWIDKVLLLTGWSIWGMFLPVKGYFHRKIRVGDTVCRSAAILLAPSALFLGDLPVRKAF